jgi:hypothetical protein
MAYPESTEKTNNQMEIIANVGISAAGGDICLENAR